MLSAGGARGARVDIDAAGAGGVRDSIRARGGEAEVFRADVTEESEVRDMVSDVVALFGTVDILVNSAGGGRVMPFLEMTGQEWDEVVSFNLRSVFLCCRAVAEVLVQKGSGRIVNVASLAGRSTSVLQGAHYTSAKAGVLGVTRHLARELGPHGVAVNAVAPGVTLTDRIRRRVTPEREEELIRSIPLRRLATAEDQAKVILFLASDMASYVTGATIDVNGGLLFM
jgi:NAD(P)-dependent dehydrogenase (short-subunit alcohol dehydrogenase family)